LVALLYLVVATCPTLPDPLNAGCSQSTDLPEILAKILNQVSLLLGTKLILFGGSGGGYATLSVIQLMASQVSAVVWNPQTSISKYYSSAVVNYISTCFPGETVDEKKHATLERLGVRHDLNLIYKDPLSCGSHQILYIQNVGDHFHVQNHAKPFMQTLNVEEVGENVYTSKAGFCFWFNHWGDGHLAPSREVILTAVEGLANGLSPLNISKRLHDG
jgi:hypothetical protein